jgi:hypothetical protein
MALVLESRASTQLDIGRLTPSPGAVLDSVMGKMLTLFDLPES